MSRSFYWDNDAQLYTGAKNFSTKISASPSSFGLSASQATSYAATEATWSAAYEVAVNPTTRTKSAIAAKNSARDQIRLATANLAKVIDGTPTVTDAQKIDLGLAVRGTPTPPANPGTPSDFKVELDALGALHLSWKCTNPTGGTMYAVWRKIGDGPAVYIAGCGAKKMVDATVPAGTPQVTYQIQAQRTTAAGAWATFVVNLGVNTSGATSAMSVTPSPVKIAA